MIASSLSVLVISLPSLLFLSFFLSLFQEKSFFMDCHVDRETNDLVFAVRQGKELQISSAASLGQFFDSKG